MNRPLPLHHRLPEELLMEILVRLPMKSFIRLKCVCKYWYALIQSPNFVGYHYHHPNNRSRIVVRHKIDHHKFERHKIERDVPVFQINTVVRLYPLEFAFSMFPNETLILGGRGGVYDRIVRFEDKRSYCVVGPIDGLFLFHKYYSNQVAIWNPATTEFKLLPKPNLGIVFPPFDPTINVFGFGLDPLTNDYKVVCTPEENSYLSSSVGTCSSSWPRKGAAVCTVSNYSWRDIDGPNLGLPGSDRRIVGGCKCKSDATYLNGCYYWLSRLWLSKLHKYGQYKLLVFDMGTDVFREMSTPAYCNNNNNNDPSLTHSSVTYDLTLALHGDNIALLITEQSHHIAFDSTSVYGPPSSISVCVMKNNREEQEEEEGCCNWVKLYTLKLTPTLSQQLRYPLGLWKENGIFFQDKTCRLVLYNNSTHEIIDLGVGTHDFGSYNSIMVFNYKESLVSFGGEKKDKSHSMLRDYFA